MLAWMGLKVGRKTQPGKVQHDCMEIVLPLSAIHHVAFTRLTRLDLACTSATTVSARGLARLVGLTALRNVSLCGIYTLTDEAVSHLASLTLMTSLDLRMCVRLTNAALDSLKDLQQLEWLRFGMSTSNVACGEAVPGNLKMALLRGLRVSHDWDHQDDKRTLP